LCAVEGAKKTSDDQCVGIAFFEPHLAAVPLAFFWVKDIAQLPHTSFREHIDEYCHAEQGLVFAVAGTFAARFGGIGTEYFHNFAIHLAIGFVYLNVAFVFACFVVLGLPDAEGSLRVEGGGEQERKEKNQFFHSERSGVKKGEKAGAKLAQQPLSDVAQTAFSALPAQGQMA